MLQHGALITEDAWLYCVQNEKCLKLVEFALLADPSIYDKKDKSGRVISLMAVPSVIQKMAEIRLWFGRFQLIDSRPEHESETCMVFKAEDQGSRKQAKQNPSSWPRQDSHLQRKANRQALQTAPTPAGERHPQAQ